MHSRAALTTATLGTHSNVDKCTSSEDSNRLPKMLLPDQHLKMEIGFFTQPPSCVRADATFEEPVIVLFNIFAHTHTAISPHAVFTPWIPGSLELLHFEAEFIPLGPALSSEPAVVCLFPAYNSSATLSREDLPCRLKFYLRAVPRCGVYLLQITGSIERITNKSDDSAEGITRTVIGRAIRTSNPIHVHCTPPFCATHREER
jgi:hypothetical protein